MHLIFETQRLTVRRYDENDGDNFYSLSGNEEVMRYIRPVHTREASDKFLKENIESYRLFPARGRWAVNHKESGEFVGSFAIIPIPGQPEKIQLGYSLLPPNWGKGYATELTIAGLDFFFRMEKLSLIYGVTEIPNLASQHVLEKAGFQKQGSYMEEGKELLLFVYRKHQQP